MAAAGTANPHPEKTGGWFGEGFPSPRDAEAFAKAAGRRSAPLGGGDYFSEIVRARGRRIWSTTQLSTTSRATCARRSSAST
jgi:hypothetical protein